MQDDRLKLPTVRALAAADEAPAVETIVLAFAADPVARWVWPRAEQYLASMPRTGAGLRRTRFHQPQRNLHRRLRRRGAVAAARSSSR